MITFLTLFLGLTLGPQTVELQADPTVAAVELRLDGEVVTRLEGPPWRGRVDLGWELAPRFLEAVALDAEGRELDRARQSLNLPRAPAEVTLYFDHGGDTSSGDSGDPDPPRRVRLAWQSVLGEAPTAVRMELDGEPLAGATLAGADLPPLDEDTVHFLRVELDFPDNLTASEELVFGGGVQEEIDTQLTAVPVVAEGRPPSVTELAGWVESVAQPAADLRVRAVEAGGVDLLVVPDDGTQGALERLLLEWRSQSSVRLGMRTDPQSLEEEIRRAYKLLPEQRLRLLWPHPQTRRSASKVTDIFLSSAPFTEEDGGLLWLMSRVRPNIELSRATQLAEAVAVAGNQAAARDRRRAVVLLWNGGRRDRSQLAPVTVRRYLERLRVPLFVWSLAEDGSDGGWGEATDVSTLNKLDRALRRLRRHLEDQRILWVDGRHLPQDLELTPRARKLTLARTPVPASAGPSRPPANALLPVPEVPAGQGRASGGGDRQSAGEEPAGAAGAAALEHLGLPQEPGSSLFDVGQAPEQAPERILLEAGTGLRTLPAADAPRLAVVDAAVEVPVVEERRVAQRLWWRVAWAGRSGWVPVGEDGRVAAGVEPLVPVTVAADSPAPSTEDRLERAAAWLSPAGTLGPWPLWTDLDAAEAKGGEVLARLSRLAQGVPAVWTRRTGLPVASEGVVEAVLLFSREADYRAFTEAEDPAVVELGLAGHAGGGLAVLAVGERDWETLAALLVHELVHLLSERALPEGLPPWLAEGLADDLAYSRIGKEGRLIPGTLGGSTDVRVESSRLSPGTVRVDRRQEVSGARATLGRLRRSQAARQAPTLEELTALPWESFVRPEGRALRYATSAFLVRFLQERHSEGFHAFLAAVAEGEPANLETLLGHLEAAGSPGADEPARLQREFESWVRASAAREGVL